nr:protein ripply2 isoform X1 [Pongo pygmaeus]
MRLAGERGGEAANLSMCSRPRGLYKARVSDPLELAKIARELAAAFSPALRSHGDRRRRRGHREWSCGVHGHRRPYAARGRGLRVGFSALLCASQLPPSLPPAPPQLLPSNSPSPTPRCQRSASVDSPGSGLTSPLRALCSPSRRYAAFWRPWVDAGGKKEEQTPNHAADAMPDGPGMTAASGKLSQFRHPVRLFWPKSKCYDYLYQEAEALLKYFPIQATISFYEDSDSEDEIEELTCEN